MKKVLITIMATALMCSIAVAGPETSRDNENEKQESCEVEYEWSKGFLTVDKDGYRFTDTDRTDGKETIGMYFKYNSSCAIETDFAEHDKNAIKIWYKDEKKGKYRTKTVSWIEIPTNDGGDPCLRVPVKEGENKWMMPTEEQMKTWAYYIPGKYNPCEYPDYNRDGRGVCAICDITPDSDQSTFMFFFETRYITTGGDFTREGWTSFWLKSPVEFKRDACLPYIEIKPSAAWNSKNNPVYRTDVRNVNATLHSQAHQIRCIRVK